MVFPAQRKIRKPEAKLTALEKQVAEALLKLEDDREIAVDLKVLYISAVKEFAVPDDKKAAVVFVPLEMLGAFQKDSETIVRKLEKSFQDHRFIIVGDRKIQKELYTIRDGESVRRPRAATKGGVHNGFLADLCHPIHVIGKRTIYSVGGDVKVQVSLPQQKASDVSDRVKTYAVVYKELTDNTTEFIFM